MVTFKFYRKKILFENCFLLYIFLQLFCLFVLMGIITEQIPHPYVYYVFFFMVFIFPILSVIIVKILYDRKHFHNEYMIMKKNQLIFPKFLHEKPVNKDEIEEIQMIPKYHLSSLLFLDFLFFYYLIDKTFSEKLVFVLHSGEEITITRKNLDINTMAYWMKMVFGFEDLIDYKGIKFRVWNFKEK